MIEVGSSADGLSVRLAPGLETILEQVPDWLRSVGRPGSDPAADRLTPHAYADDAEAGSEFDRLMLPELDAGRTHDREVYAAALARVAGGETVLTEEEVFSVLRVIDEGRLVVAARIGIDDDHWEPTPELERSPELHLYYLLGWIQDALIDGAEPLLLGHE